MANEKPEDVIRSVYRIVDYWSEAIYDDDAEDELADLFLTEPGKILGSHVDDLLGFVQKGVVLARARSVLPTKGVMEMFAGGEFRDAIEEGGHELEEDDLEMVGAIETFFKHAGKTEDADHETMMEPDDWLWYLSLFTFALYAYLDVYSRNILDLVLKGEELRSRLEGFLENQSERLEEELDSTPITVKDLKGSSVKNRFFCLAAGLELDMVLERILNESNLERYSDAFDAFLRIRHKIAHSNPRLEAEKYTYSDFEADLKDFEAILERIDEISVDSKFVRRLLDQLAESLPDFLSMFGRFYLIMKMATLYPSLLDSVFNAAYTT